MPPSTAPSSSLPSRIQPGSQSPQTIDGRPEPASTPAPPSAGGRPRPLPPEPSQDAATRLGLLLSMVTGLTAAMALFLRRSGFVGSDFFSLRDAQNDGLSLGYLLSPVFDHFVPGHRFVNWVVQSLAPLDFRLATVVSLIVFAASLLVMHRLLAELLRAGPWPLLLTLFYGASAIHVATALNWAASLSRLPADALGLASMVAHLRYRRTGRTALLAWSVGLLAAAVLFSETAVLYLLFLLALRVLILYPEESPRQSLVGVAGEWWVWVPYLLPVLIPVLGSTAQTASAYDVYGLESLARYLATGWFQAFVPALVGQLVNPGRLTGAEVAVVVAGQLVVLGLVAWSVVRRPSAWRAWMLVAVAFVGTQLPVGLIRTGFFTPEFVAHQYRYYSEVVAVFTIALGAAFLPVRSGIQDHVPAELGVDASARRWLTAALTSVGLLYVGCSLWTSNRLTEAYDGRRAGPYISALRADLRERGNVTVLDGELPDFVIRDFHAPYNRLSMVVPLAGAGARVGTTGSDLYRVGPDGHLRPVTFTAQAGGRAVELAATPALATLPAASQSADGARLCVASNDSPSIIGYSPGRPVGPGEWFLRLRYRAAATSVGYVRVDRGAGFVDGNEPVLPLRSDRTESLAAVGEGNFSQLMIVLPKDFQLCLAELVLATVEPRGR